MTLADDANAPIQYAGRTYKALTMADVAALTERIPPNLTPRHLLPYVSVTEAMRFGRSPFGLGPLMAIVAEQSGVPTDDLPAHQQLELAARLAERFYGMDMETGAEDGDTDDGDKDKAPDPLADAPASSQTPPA